MRTIINRLLVLGLACCAWQNVRGFQIVNTFGPGDSFELASYGVVWNVLSPGSSINVGQGFAARLTPNANYTLTSVTLALGYIQDTNNLSISIFEDASGTPAGQLLETIVSHPTDITGFSGVNTYQSSLDPVMAGGSSYWLVVAPVDLNEANSQNNAAYSWYASTHLGYAATRDFNFTSGSWANWQVYPNSLLPAFRIEGTAVPEPGTLALTLAGTAGLVGLRGWRNRRWLAHRR